jgi:hypothetical protein
MSCSLRSMPSEKRSQFHLNKARWSIWVTA